MHLIHRNRFLALAQAADEVVVAREALIQCAGRWMASMIYRGEDAVALLQQIRRAGIQVFQNALQRPFCDALFGEFRMEIAAKAVQHIGPSHLSGEEYGLQSVFRRRHQHGDEHDEHRIQDALQQVGQTRREQAERQRRADVAPHHDNREQ